MPSLTELLRRRRADGDEEGRREYLRLLQIDEPTDEDVDRLEAVMRAQGITAQEVDRDLGIIGRAKRLQALAAELPARRAAQRAVQQQITKATAEEEATTRRLRLELADLHNKAGHLADAVVEASRAEHELARVRRDHGDILLPPDEN